MTEHYDIVIVGAGLIGASLALDLAQRSSLRIGLFERSPPIDVALDERTSNQRVVALGKPAIAVLKRINVFEQLHPDHAHAYQSMSVWDEGSDGELYFSAEQLGEPELGFMVDSLACTQCLQEQIQLYSGGNLSCSFNTHLLSLGLSKQGVELETSQGSIMADLIIGADGAQSWVRTQSKVFANRFDYKQRGIVAKIKTSKSHEDCAWQRFLSTGPVAALPVKDNFSSIVWSADNELAGELMELSDEAFCLALSRAFDFRLGDILEIGKRQSFPLVSQRAQSYWAPSMILVGDAAHSIHPLAGQGANLGFKDLACLSELLMLAPRSQIGSLELASFYESKRKQDNEQTDWFMSALNAGFRFDAPLWLGVRGLGMNLINSRGRLKSLFAQQAIGGD